MLKADIGWNTFSESQISGQLAELSLADDGRVLVIHLGLENPVLGLPHGRQNKRFTLESVMHSS